MYIAILGDYRLVQKLTSCRTFSTLFNPYNMFFFFFLKPLVVKLTFDKKLQHKATMRLPNA